MDKMTHNPIQDSVSDDDDDGMPVASVASLSYLGRGSSMKPKFDAMLKEIEQKLPSVGDEDSDFEDFSGDEVEIFQRPSSYGQLTIEDADKDLDESLTSSELNEPWSWRPSRSAEPSVEDLNVTPQTENTTDTTDFSTDTNLTDNNDGPQSWFLDSNRNVDLQEHNSADLESLMTDVNLSHTISEPREAWPEYDNSSDQFPSSSPQEPPSTSSPGNQSRASQGVTEQGHSQSRRSRRDLHRNQISRTSAVKLSLGSLERVDLDIALQSVVEDEYQRRQRSRSSSLDLFDLQPGDHVGKYRDPNKCTELMQSLVDISSKQVGEKLDIDPMSGADRSVRRKPLSKYEADMVGEKSSQNQPGSVRTMSSGMNTADMSASTCKVIVPRARAERLCESQQLPPSAEPMRDTVFLDLRKTDQELDEERNRLAVVQRVLKINGKREQSSDSSSDSSSEDDRDQWFEQRRRIREAIERGEPPPPPTERFKVKPARRKVTVAKRLASMPAVNPPQLAAECCAVAATCEKLSSDAAETAARPTAGSNVVNHANDQVRQRKLDAAEHMRKARLEAEKVLKAKQALFERLNKELPVLSIDKKRVAAAATPLLYHIDASHEPTLWCIPDNISKRDDITLLTVKLSSNGEMMANRSQPNSTSDRYVMSMSYIALVSWLCSLIPEDVEDTSPPVTHQQPFNVIGLQQMVISESLVLAIAVAPNGYVDDKLLFCLGGPSKKGIKMSVFHRLLNKFLTTTTLRDVNPWMSEVYGNLVNPAVPGAGFVYQPKVRDFTSKPLSSFVQVQTNPEGIKQYFAAEFGFYWQTVSNDEHSHYGDDDIPNVDKEGNMQTTMVLVYKNIYREPDSLFNILARMLTHSLDICGLRLASFCPAQGVTRGIGPVLAIAIRGAYARPVWIEQLGPMNPSVAKQAEPGSITALYGGANISGLSLFTPRNPVQLSEELSRWFGGRITDIHSALGSSNGQAAHDSLNDSFTAMTRTPPVSLLSATTSSDVFVVISTLLPIKCIGIILAISQRRGFMLRGIRRRRLNQKQVSALGINAEFAAYYSSDYTQAPTSPRAPPDTVLGHPMIPYAHHTAARPVTILHLNRENASNNATAYVENCMIQLTLQGLLDGCNDALDEDLTADHLFHAVPYSDVLLTQLGRDFTKVPDYDSPATTGYIAPRLHSNAEIEQISVLTLVGDTMIAGGYLLLLARLLNTLPVKAKFAPQFTTDPEGLELLGIKWLPALNSAQARELTPHEVGQPEWRSSLRLLTAEPALVMVFRGVNCAQRIKDIMFTVKSDRSQASLDRMVSPTPELAYRLTSLFFFDRELFADNDSRTLTMYLPPLRSEVKSTGDKWDDDGVTAKSKRPRSGRGSKTPPQTPPQASKVVEESIFKTLLMGPRPIVTVLIIKPSGLARRNLAKLLRGILLERFGIIAMRLVKISGIQAACLQSNAIRTSEQLHKEDLAHMTSGSSLVLALSRENAVKKLIELVGPEDPKVAKQCDPFFWRGMYGSSIIANGFYASTSYPAAVGDLKQFFPDGVCCTTTIDLTADGVPAPGTDSRLSAGDRVAVECAITNPGPYHRHLHRLNEVNCIVLMTPLVRFESDSRNAKFTDIIQCLYTSDVCIQGARMLWLTEEQAQRYLHVIDAGTFSQVPRLCAGPIIVLAVQCSNAVISFDYIMETGMLKINKKKGDYLPHMQTPKDIPMAGRMLAFFFDELLGDDCKMKICKREVQDGG